MQNNMSDDIGRSWYGVIWLNTDVDNLLVKRIGWSLVYIVRVDTLHSFAINSRFYTSMPYVLHDWDKLIVRGSNFVKFSLQWLCCLSC
jgi:hypothetical protein